MTEAAREASLPFAIETELEARVCGDPDWLTGAEWGDPRPGHPEGATKFHIAEVFANVDRYAANADDRARLRLIALVHDTFKHQVNPEKPRVGENHHGMLARRFSERYIADTALLDIIELHDDAFNAYSMGLRREAWVEADKRAQRLLDRLGPNRQLYLTFFRCDDETGSKDSEAFEWFAAKVQLAQ
jgi:hypothetical protein